MNGAEELVQTIMAEIPKHFRIFGGGVVSTPTNPISQALKDQPLQFAAGVDVRDVVETVAGMTLMHVLEKFSKEGADVPSAGDVD